MQRKVNKLLSYLPKRRGSDSAKPLLRAHGIRDMWCEGITLPPRGNVILHVMRTFCVPHGSHRMSRISAATFTLSGALSVFAPPLCLLQAEVLRLSRGQQPFFVPFPLIDRQCLCSDQANSSRVSESRQTRPVHATKIYPYQ